MYSFIDGKREGVVFAFYDATTDHILLEVRDKEGKDIFFTNGSIEEGDKKGKFDNYKKNALFREIDEEFSSKIKIEEEHAHFIETLYVEEINVIFYIYLIPKWQGIFPEYTTEDDKEFAKLKWVPFNSAYEAIPYDSGKEILNFLKSKRPISER